jgi:uridine monophosphate synthetase
MNFFEKLEIRSGLIDSILCVGLDPHIEDLNQKGISGVFDFCKHLINETGEFAAAFKPNSGFFEAFGAEGFSVLKDVIEYIPAGIPVILDGKRGDISSTARAYADAVFDYFEADAVTLNPYLGRDSIECFIENPRRAAFLLCKTSNPGADDLQDLELADRVIRDSATRVKVFEQVAILAESWNRKKNLGLVVGATQPEALSSVRQITPGMWFLSPGVGAQGGSMELALASGLRKDRTGMLVNVSRSISRAPSPSEAARSLVQQLNRIREADLPTQKPTHSRGESRHRFHGLAEILLRTGCIQFGEFTLKSGIQSPIYFDLRRLAGYPAELQLIASQMVDLMQPLDFELIAGIPYAAIPIATAVSLASGWPMIYPRKEVKEYGTRALVEGVYTPGQTAVLIDDLATTGGSKLSAMETVNRAGIMVRDVVVVIDRQSGASRDLQTAGLQLHSLVTLEELINQWEASAEIPTGELQKVREFLSNSERN